MGIIKEIENTVDDLVDDFLYYGRKEDEDLGVGEIERVLEMGAMTKEQIVERFKNRLYSKLCPNS